MNLRSKAKTSEWLGADVIIERARSLHRIVRALHDGHCPKCGAVFPCEAARLENREQRPRCEFFITHEEAEAACKEFAPIMRRNLEVFEAWRASRAPNDQAQRPGHRDVGQT